MAELKMTLDPANPPKLSAEDRARMDSMTDDQITRAAESDLENPALTAEEMARIRKARYVRQARHATGLSQEVFAREFLISPGRLKDIEQGRTEPDSAFLAYMAMVLLDPVMVRSTLTGAFIAAGELRN